MASVHAFTAAIASSGTARHCADAAWVPEFPVAVISTAAPVVGTGAVKQLRFVPAVARHASAHRFAPRALKLWRRNTATLRRWQSVWQA